MSLLNKILPAKEEKEYFLTIGLEESRIHATVSLISEKKVTIIGTGESEFSQEDEETEAADIAISEAEKKIGENVLVRKVIFGLPVSLVEKDQIKESHLARLKKITKTLSLIPCGFIEYPQALSYYLETKEDSPPTLLLLSIGKTQMTFSHIRVGKVEKNIIITSTSSFISDFENALSEFSSSEEILPSRVMLYNESGDTSLEKIRDELSKFSWHKHSTFLHTPKIEILETQAITFALVEAAAKSLAKELHIDHVEEKDVIQTPKELEPESQDSKEESFGFIKDKDINQEQDTIVSPPKEEQASQKKNREENIFTNFPKLQFELPRFPFSFLGFPAGIIGLSIVVFIIFLLFVVWYYPKATINLIVYPISTSNQVGVTFSTSSQNEKAGQNIISATSVSEEVTGTKTIATTGVSKIGEKARGSVTIYNKTLAAKNFPKGTILVSDDLKFTLDEEVIVASASDTGEGLTFGKSQVKISAQEIGPESNLSVGTNFSFKDFDKSSYYTKNNEKLSGGTSRDITSVSKDDQDKLLANLTEELTQNAKQQVNKKINPEDKLLDISLDTNITSKKFNKSISEEAKEVELSLAVKVSGMVYKTKNLTDLTSINPTQTPAGYILSGNKTQIKITDAKKNSKGDVVAQATITYFFFPQLDTEKIKSDLSGKNFSESDKYLSSIKTIGGVEIISDNQFPFVKNRLPLKKENINIILVSR